MTRELSVAKFAGNETEMIAFAREWISVTTMVRENAKKKGIDLADMKIGVKRDA